MKKTCLFCKKHNKVHVICELEERYFFTGQKLIRPKVNWFAALIKVFLAFLCGFVLAKSSTYVLTKYTGTKGAWEYYLFVSVYIATLIAIILAKSKSIMIFVIHVYQRYAPYPTRATCVFIPNCSDYMILAIQKYGTFRGIKKGIARFKRCEYPNGGIDYP